jgi:hypothetical protein
MSRHLMQAITRALLLLFTVGLWAAEDEKRSSNAVEDRQAADRQASTIAKPSSFRT